MSESWQVAANSHARAQRAFLAVVTVLLSLSLRPAAALADDAPALDVFATEQAIGTQQIYRAPGAVAALDERTVRAELTPDTRVVLAPWVGYKQTDADSTTTDALRDWAREHELKLIVVTGLSVRLLSGGHFTPSELSGLQAQLAYSDVTDLVVLSARNIRDGTSHLDDPQPAQAAADPAEIATMVAALRTNPRYVAPGAGPAIPAGELVASQTPGLPYRVALLPALPLGVPFTNLAPAISQAFPGELVIVARGRWVDAAGPGQDEVDSARNYMFGRYAKAYEQWGTPPDKLVSAVLDRLAQLRDGAAFHRPMVRPVLAAELFHRYALGVFIALAVLLGGIPLGWWGYHLRRSRLSAAGDLRVERARTYAELATVGAGLVAADATTSHASADTELLGDAAERHATARTLLVQAETPGAVRAARAAGAQAQTLLARAAGSTG